MRALLFCLILAAASAATPEDAVRAVLEGQQQAWNRGELDAFLDGYLDSPELTFCGHNGVTRGLAGVRERYRKNYGSREAMGTLAFSELEVRLLSPEIALVLGRFQLTRSAAGGGDASGHFTLVMRKSGGRWKIIHDHTS